MTTPQCILLPKALRLIQGVDFRGKLGICERLFGRSIARAGTCWVQTGAGISWKLDLTNETLRWIVYGKYEGSAFLNWARRFVPRDGVVVDSGANIGQMLLYLAQWVPDGQVLAFEPGQHQADWLQECLEAHPRMPVQLIRQGLGEINEVAYLKECGDPNRHGSWNQVSKTEGEPIEIVRLADALSIRNITHVCLWKLDVEGFEMQALRGAGEWLSEHRIDAIYVELAGENGARIRTFLGECGYDCHLFSGSGKLKRVDENTGHTNGLFLPPKVVVIERHICHGGAF